MKGIGKKIARMKCIIMSWVLCICENHIPAMIAKAEYDKAMFINMDDNAFRHNSTLVHNNKNHYIIRWCIFSHYFMLSIP